MATTDDQAAPQIIAEGMRSTCWEELDVGFGSGELEDLTINILNTLKAQDQIFN